MQGFAVTCVESGDTCPRSGHASLIGVFETYDKAKEYVIEDMKDVAATAAIGEIDATAFERMEIWDGHQGCAWDILDLSRPECEKGKDKDDGQ